MALKNREPTESINLNKETEGSCSNRSENSSDNIKLDISRTTPAIDSHPQTSRPFFPSSLIRPNTAQQLFQTTSSSSRPPPADHHHLIQCQNNNNNNPTATVKEESSLCNMFCTIDDQTGFWPWLEQHHFN